MTFTLNRRQFLRVHAGVARLRTLLAQLRIGIEEAEGL